MKSKSDCSDITNCTYENKPDKKGRNRHRIPTIFARLILGSVFIYAGFGKILHPALFAETIYNYQILPDALINLTAIVLPWLELILGAFLILGLWLPGAVLLSNLLMGTFFGALVFNLARGLDIHCGCFSTSQEGTSNLCMCLYVIRDGIFLLLGLYLLSHIFFSKRRAFAVTQRIVKEAQI